MIGRRWWANSGDWQLVGRCFSFEEEGYYTKEEFAKSAQGMGGRKPYGSSVNDYLAARRESRVAFQRTRIPARCEEICSRRRVTLSDLCTDQSEHTLECYRKCLRLFEIMLVALEARSPVLAPCWLILRPNYEGGSLKRTAALLCMLCMQKCTKG